MTVVLALQMAGSVHAETPASPLQRDPATGIWRYELASEFQSGPTAVEVLLPDVMAEGKRYPVLYILPVEPEGKTVYGSGLLEAKKADAANRFQIICVAPSFKVVPWYGNHATDPRIRQEDFMVKTLVTEIDQRFPTKADKESRWLLGFSKSGWGACTLWLQHPEVFGYAGTWDAPFLLNGDNHGKEWGPIGIKSVFGTKETFQACLPTRLVVANAATLRDRPRMVLGVGKDWKAHGEGMHALLDQSKIPHGYRPDLLVVHRWDTGWFGPVLEDLVKMALARPTGG